MKFCKISTLTAYTMLLLAAGLISGCKPLVEPKENPTASKEIVTEPAQSMATITEPVISTDEVGSLESLESLEFGLETPADIDIMVATSEDQVQAIDDGADVVKATPAIMRKVQQALVDAGFKPGSVDGVSGPRTVAAIESFQKQNGIAAGKLTKETLRALGVDF
jgi:peptidoglycan hydrolase-like protein with peptidoglycan-binding domain